jgi:phosphoribosyl 1,2-cyclic phosphate phosphodiesterase
MGIKFTILGCGSSMGVPKPDGDWGKCNPLERKNYRTRCSALIGTKNRNILIDTSPDLREQMIKNKIKKINNVLYSHPHADQTHGINDLRVFHMKTKKKILIYADRSTSKYLKSNFSYCFKNSTSYPSILNLKLIKKKTIIDGVLINSIPVRHGQINSQCYIINKKCAYASDVDLIYEKDFKFFFKIDKLVIDCLRFKYHPTHYNLDDVLKLIKDLKPKKAILTNLHSDLDYNNLLKYLPKGVVPAFDGMNFNI